MSRGRPSGHARSRRSRCRPRLLGATAGLLIGLGIELLREKFDDKMSTAEEIEEITGRPLLAQIPKDDAVAGTASPVVVRPGEFTEAVRALRTGLQFLGVDHPVRRIVVSSAGTGDGKTTVAAHLAVAYAEAGFVTVLVSGDLRRPQVESLFGASNTGLGLSSLLAAGPLRPRTAPHVNGEGNLVSGNDADCDVARTATATATATGTATGTGIDDTRPTRSPERHEQADRSSCGSWRSRPSIDEPHADPGRADAAEPGRAARLHPHARDPRRAGRARRRDHHRHAAGARRDRLGGARRRLRRCADRDVGRRSRPAAI